MDIRQTDIQLTSRPAAADKVDIVLLSSLWVLLLVSNKETTYADQSDTISSTYFWAKKKSRIKALTAAKTLLNLYYIVQDLLIFTCISTIDEV